MKKIFFCIAFTFLGLPYNQNLFAQSALNTEQQAQELQQKANKLVIGKWWNGMEMGGITLEIMPDNTYTLTDHVSDEITEKGKWTITKTTLILISEEKNKTVLHYFDNATVKDKNKIALRGKGCASTQGYCYFKAE